MRLGRPLLPRRRRRRRDLRHRPRPSTATTTSATGWGRSTSTTAAAGAINVRWRSTSWSTAAGTRPFGRIPCACQATARRVRDYRPRVHRWADQGCPRVDRVPRGRPGCLLGRSRRSLTRHRPLVTSVDRRWTPTWVPCRAVGHPWAVPCRVRPWAHPGWCPVAPCPALGPRGCHRSTCRDRRWAVRRTLRTWWAPWTRTTLAPRDPWVPGDPWARGRVPGTGPARGPCTPAWAQVGPCRQDLRSRGRRRRSSTRTCRPTCRRTKWGCTTGLTLLLLCPRGEIANWATVWKWATHGGQSWDSCGDNELHLWTFFFDKLKWMFHVFERVYSSWLGCLGRSSMVYLWLCGFQPGLWCLLLVRVRVLFQAISSYYHRSRKASFNQSSYIVGEWELRLLESI